MTTEMLAAVTEEEGFSGPEVVTQAGGPVHPGMTTAVSGQILLASAAGGLAEMSRLPMVVLGLAQVVEVMTFPELRPAPEGSGGLLGLASWREEDVPVLDLGAALGLSPFQAGARSRLLIARLARKAMVGFPVHPNVQTARLPLAAIPDVPPPGANAGAILGAFRWEGVQLIVPDLEQIQI